MTFRFKFNLILAGCFALFWLGSALFFGLEVEHLSSDAVSAEARLHMQAALAIREYTQEHVKSYFDAQPDKSFEKISVPAFAARRTLELLYQNFPGYQYREAALNPTNPGNLAHDWEKVLIDGYRSQQTLRDEVQIHTSQDGQSMYAVKPIRISNETCLSCHGAQETAPAAMHARYPGSGGFGWRMGEVVGAQIVTIPKQAHSARFQREMRSFDVALLVIFGSLFVILNLLLECWVLKPLQHNNHALNSLAETDALTMVANRRAFDRGLAVEIKRAGEQSLPLCVLLLDIDHFKRVNDELGHGVGDEVLRQLARELSQKFRANDLFARLGGEEFVAMLPGLRLDDALLRANALREYCAQMDFEIDRSITVSIGVAQWDGRESAAALIMRCDAALYRAKHQGRNRVETALTE